jgi:ABC-type multidrug transport system ATPase subunit
MTIPTFSLRDLSRSFGPKYALRRINLEIAKGEIIALVGSNGSGKTTLLRILSTLLRPSSGQIMILGVDATHRDAQMRRKIGALFIDGYLYGDLTVKENLHLYGKLLDIADADSTIDRWLDRIDMRAFENEPVKTLSRGERQRIALIRSLLHNPQVLLWDEPTTGLDQRARALFEELAIEQKGNRTVVFATHDAMAEQRWVDRVITLRQGQIQ